MLHSRASWESARDEGEGARATAESCRDESRWAARHKLNFCLFLHLFLILFKEMAPGPVLDTLLARAAVQVGHCHECIMLFLVLKDKKKYDSFCIQLGLFLVLCKEEEEKEDITYAYAKKYVGLHVCWRAKEWRKRKEEKISVATCWKLNLGGFWREGGLERVKQSESLWQTWRSSIMECKGQWRGSWQSSADTKESR